MNPVKSNASQKIIQGCCKNITACQQEMENQWVVMRSNKHGISVMICGRMLTENEKGMFVLTQDLMALIGLRSRERRRSVQIIERLEACDEHENEARNKSYHCFTTN